MKKTYFGILDLHTLAELYEAQPIVSMPENEAAVGLVKALPLFSSQNKRYEGCLGTQYWLAGLKELIELSGLEKSLEERTAGQIYRGLGLVLHRRNDGYKVAWSERQLAILMKIFGIRNS